MKVLFGKLFLSSAMALGSVTMEAASAQCVKLTFRTYGQTCAFFNQAATLSPAYDGSTCVMTLTLGRSQTCCNTFLTGQFLFLSTRPISPGIQDPLLVPGCLLSVVPDFVLPLPQSSGGIVKLPIPPTLVNLTFYAQGLNDYLTTIGLTHDYQTSQGLSIAIF
ncbi:MAG: hypothetical protein H6832_17375 [Planctomycetes bacterium]|nr:hypothetical protein [Planctomycetota bacterium]